MERYRLTEGTVEGKYRVEKAIKWGGQGAVMKCVDTEKGTSVALKVMAANGAKDTLHFNYINALSQTTACEYLAPYLDYWTKDDKTYIVMPLYKYDLEDLLKGRDNHFTETEIINFFKQIFNGLHHIHKVGLSHKDMKLGNVMLDSANKIKIVDLNTVRETNKTLTINVSTPLYAAPELCLARPICLEATDVYAVGVMMMEMIAKVRAKDITTSGFCFKLEDADEDYTHGELLFRMNQNNNISKVLKSLVISIIRYNPAIRPSISTIQQVFTAIENRENEDQIINGYNLKSINNVKLPQTSTTITGSAAAAEFVPHTLQDLLKPEYKYIQVEQQFSSNKIHRIANANDPHESNWLLVEYNCIKPVGPLQLLFNENCVDYNNTTIIEELEKQTDYKLFVPNIRVFLWEENPTKARTYVVIPLIQTDLKNEFTTRQQMIQKEQKYFTVIEIVNWLQPIVCAVALMHKKMIIHGSLNMESILKLKIEPKNVKLLCNYSTFEQLNDDPQSSMEIQEKLKQDIKDLGFILYQMICLQDVSSLPMIQWMKSEKDENLVHCHMCAAMTIHPSKEKKLEALKQLVCEMVRYELILTCSIFKVKEELERISAIG